jgi:hypothetical protein
LIRNPQENANEGAVSEDLTVDHRFVRLNPPPRE